MAYTHRKDCFALQDGTARSSQNFGNYLSTLRNILDGQRSDC